ncbi:branched-chain amino acid transport system II carrier protein, partial [Anaerosalibacter massiliensis]
MTNRAGLVAGALLLFIYGGLTYVGATGSSVFRPDMPRVDLLLALVNELFGSAGAIAISIVVSLACLTTSVGLTATTANYFNDISNGKVSYKFMVIAVTICSFFLSLLGVEGLISIAVPVLSTIYPVIIVLILMTLFDKYIPSGATYTGAVLGAFIVSFIINLNKTFKILNSSMKLIKKLPLYENGFPWIVPAIVLSVLFMIYSKLKYKNNGINISSKK